MSKFILIISLFLILTAGFWFFGGRSWVAEKLSAKYEPVKGETTQGEEENRVNEEGLIEILVGEPEEKVDPESGEVSITIPNPAADFCLSQGYEYETAVNSDGSQYGVCVFGETACPGWDYYQGKCQPGERPIKYINH